MPALCPGVSCAPPDTKVFTCEGPLELLGALLLRCLAHPGCPQHCCAFQTQQALKCPQMVQAGYGCTCLQLQPRFVSPITGAGFGSWLFSLPCACWRNSLPSYFRTWRRLGDTPGAGAGLMKPFPQLRPLLPPRFHPVHGDNELFIPWRAGVCLWPPV